MFLVELFWKDRPEKVIVLYTKKTYLPPVFPSTAEHVEFRGNLGGPSPKAKYTPMTDSELVP